MSQTTVIPQLTRWGLSSDGDLVYRALAMSGACSDAHLARELGLSRARVARALDELAEAGAARPATGPGRATRVWAPAQLDDVLAALRIHRRPQVREQWHRHLRVVEGLNLPEVDGTRVRHWATRDLARRRLAHLVAAERHEQLAINTEPVFDADSVAAASPLDRSLLDRGIRLRVLGLPVLDGDRSSDHAAALGAGSGGYRECDDLPLKLIVVDRQAALLPADPADITLGYLEIRDPATVEALCALFYRHWGRARDPRREGVPAIDLSARERALITLLAAGNTDQAAADAMRVSVRTVAYALRGLMDRLGVENRFQLALILGAAGAVPLPDSPESGES